MQGLRSRGVAALMVSALMAVPMVPARAQAAAPADDRAPAAVVGLDSEEVDVGNRLTQALRVAFAGRGLSGGDEANLAELRLALGCRSDTPECLAGGGDMLGARRLVYGTVKQPAKGSWTLEIWIVEAETAAIEGHESFTFDDAELTPGEVYGAAVLVVNTLLPEEPSELPAVDLPPQEEESQPSASTPEDDRKFVWGYQRPTPRWKWTAVGVSAGMTLIGIAGVVGTSVWLTSESRGFRKKLLDAANASLVDEQPLNDVNPNLSEGNDLCAVARARPINPETGEPQGQEGQVRNASVVKVCDDGDTVKSANSGLIAFSAVSLVTTAVFTTLLFVHRKPTGSEAWRRHRLQVGLSPRTARGATLHLGGRF